MLCSLLKCTSAFMLIKMSRKIFKSLKADYKTGEGLVYGGVDGTYGIIRTRNVEYSFEVKNKLFTE